MNMLEIVILLIVALYFLSKIAIKEGYEYKKVNGVLYVKHNDKWIELEKHLEEHEKEEIDNDL